MRLLLTTILVAGLAACTHPAGAGIPVAFHVTAGPTCPVERDPPDPNCADRPVVGAELVVTDASGATVARGRSNASGDLVLELAAGSYQVVPQPVGGVMGTAPAQPFSVVAGTSQVPVAVGYDTGIR